MPITYYNSREHSIGKNSSGEIIICHTHGNPIDVDSIMDDVNNPNLFIPRMQILKNINHHKLSLYSCGMFFKRYLEDNKKVDADVRTAATAASTEDDAGIKAIQDALRKPL